VVVVVERQSAFPPTTTPVPLTNPADGALTILLREKDLILLDRRTLPANLTAVVGHSKTVAAAVRPISEPGKLFADHLPPTALANHQAVADTLVFDPMEAYPGQVGAHNATPVLRETSRIERPQRKSSAISSTCVT